MISSSVLQAYTGSTDTTALGQLEAGVVAWLQNWIPRYLGTSTTLTEIHDGPGRDYGRISGVFTGERLRTLWLSESIASTSLVSVEERTSPTADWADLPTPADLTDYEIRTDSPHVTTGNQLVRLSADFPGGSANIRVKYTHGYAEDAAPNDVTLATLMLVKALLAAKESGDLKSEAAEGVKLEYASLASLPGVNVPMLLALRRPGY